MGDEWNDDCPDQQDEGKKMLFKKENDETVRCGVLSIDDWGFDGENEYPEFVVKMDDGTTELLYSFDLWKFNEI